MFEVLLSVHILAAILVVGPITVAASLFPRYARQSAPDGDDPGRRAAGIAVLLHRICRGYAVVGLTVPVFGLAAGAKLGVLADPWLIASLVLTALAAGTLVLAILPGQERLLAPPPDATTHDGVRSAAARLASTTGAFNILWVLVVVLMIVRPGSTTGA
jgi:hypothetical protein